MNMEGDSSDKSDAAKQTAMMVQLTTDGVPKLYCPVCNKALVSLNGYVKHVKKHEPPGGFECRYCDSKFCSEEALKTHRDQVHTTISCRICKSEEATFTNASDYREHIRTAHNGVDRIMYTCDKCGAEYKSQEPFKRHMETECGKIKPHKCEQCQMTFVTKYNLKQHMETHSGERKFCCSFCGKSFLQKGRLVEHERSHTGQKPYKCDVCGKCFAHRESIVTHSSIHTGIRLVECRCCSSRFSCYSNLIKHRRTRPDTCGQPEYDPPKNRVRTRGSRIPATLNPTSEIKVSGFNKIIKPQEQEKVKKLPKKDASETKPLIGKTKKRGVSTRKKSLKKQRTSSSSGEEGNEDKVGGVVANAGSNDNATVSSEKAGAKNLQKNKWTDDGSSDSDNDNHPDPVECDSDTEEKTADDAKNQSLNIKQEFSDDDLEFLSATNEFEYTDSNRFANSAGFVGIKAEDDSNIFSQKDKLLRSLLNDDLSDADPMPAIKVESVLLEETEMLMLKDDTYGLSQEDEDALALKDDENSKSKSNNVTAKQNNFNKKKRKGTRKKYNHASSDDERNEDDNDNDDKDFVPKFKNNSNKNVKKTRAPRKITSKRMAKLTTTELKERLKILKKEGKSWQCPHCVKIYHMRKPFERHLREEHKLSDEEIRKLSKRDDSEVGVINDEVFKCHICDKFYLMEKRLISHIKLHGETGNLTVKCPCYCNLYFATKEDALAHAHAAHRDILFCEICNKFMSGHDRRKTHMKKYHSDEPQVKNPPPPANLGGTVLKRNFVCDKCGRKFTGRTSLMDHVRSDCGKKPLYPCDICGKHFTTAGILKTHLLLHKDDTPFQCDKCGKTFKVKAQYKTHIKTRHTDYKPFKCHLCPKEYPYRESLLIHMTVHTGIKRFLCNGCGKRFTCISNLQAHRKVHADTCGLLPLNPKATQYMGVQKGNLLLGAKPEAGLAYNETNTLVAKEVIDRDLPMAQEINFPSEPAAPLATVPLTCTDMPMLPPSMATTASSNSLLPNMLPNQPYGTV